MKSLKELMKELGFNPNAPTNSQKAFIKNLIRSAHDLSPESEIEKRNFQNVSPGTNKTATKTINLDQSWEQLVFDLSDGKRVS